MGENGVVVCGVGRSVGAYLGRVPALSLRTGFVWVERLSSGEGCIYKGEDTCEETAVAVFVRWCHDGTQTDVEGLGDR